MKLSKTFVSYCLVMAGFGVSANANTVAKASLYTEFEYHVFNNAQGTISKSKSFFSKRLTLTINDEINPVSDWSDPDSPNRNYEVGVRAELDIKDTNATGPWKTGDERCDNIKFDVLWHQSDELLTTKDLLSSGVDSKDNWNYHNLCFGFKLKIPSVRKLMIPGSEQEILLFARGIETPIAKGKLITEKAPPPSPKSEDDSNDPWHRDH